MGSDAWFKFIDDLQQEIDQNILEEMQKRF